MKSLLPYLLLSLTGIPASTTAQIFSAKRVHPSERQVVAEIRHYEVFDLDIGAVHSYIQKAGNGAPLTLLLGDHTFNWQVYENPILAEDVQGTTQVDGQYVPLEFDQRCRTFIAVSTETRQEARLLITPRNLFAFMPDGADTRMIQPFGQFVPDAEKGHIVLYTTADQKSIGIPAGHCSVPQKTLAPPGKLSKPKGSGGHTRTYNCEKLKVSFATDRSMWEQFGSVDDLLDFNLMLLSQTEFFLRTFDLDLVVTEFFIVTTTGNNANPWGNATNVNNLIDSFGDWGEDYFITEGLGHLWSNNDLHNDGDYGNIGLAYVGGTCGDIGIYQWAILERFTSNSFNLSLLQTHEYGHLLDADHEPGTNTFMEPSLNDITLYQWANANIVEMIDFMEDEDCITLCQSCPFYLDLIDHIQYGVWGYNAQYDIYSTAVITNNAKVRLEANQRIRLLPGFQATSPWSDDSSRLIARIAGCD